MGSSSGSAPRPPGLRPARPRSRGRGLRAHCRGTSVCTGHAVWTGHGPVWRTVSLRLAEGRPESYEDRWAARPSWVSGWQSAPMASRCPDRPRGERTRSPGRVQRPPVPTSLCSRPAAWTLPWRAGHAGALAHDPPRPARGASRSLAIRGPVHVAWWLSPECGQDRAGPVPSGLGEPFGPPDWSGLDPGQTCAVSPGPVAANSPPAMWVRWGAEVSRSRWVWRFSLGSGCGYCRCFLTCVVHCSLT